MLKFMVFLANALRLSAGFLNLLATMFSEFSKAACEPEKGFIKPQGNGIILF
jgi:hypothetical protein